MLQENPSAAPIPPEPALRALLVVLAEAILDSHAARNGSAARPVSVIDRARSHMTRDGA